MLSIHINPTDDTFISSAMDNTVRLWDIQQKKCLVRRPGASCSQLRISLLALT